MANGKLLVISAILKLDRHFRPPHIVDMTGLDRQLVRYHLDRLVETNILEKMDKYYVVKDKEALLNSLLETTESFETALPKPKGLFSSLKGVNRRAETVIATKALDLPMWAESKEAYIRELDETIEVIKQLRKYLTNATKTEGSAAKFYKQMEGDYEQAWKDLIISVAEPIDLATFEKAVKEKLNALSES